MPWNEIAGWIGWVSLLGSYIMLSTHKWSGDGRPYHIANLVGAVGFGINAYHHGARPIVALEIIWVSLALWAIHRAPRGK